MTTRTKTPPDRFDDDVDELELTMFGRRWKTPGSWGIPACTWALVTIAAVIVYGMQQAGRVPDSGAQFFGYTVLVTCGFAFVGLILGMGGNLGPAVWKWCVATPVIGGAWVYYVSLVGMRSGFLPWLIWLIAGAVVAVWYQTMRDAQRNHELTLLHAEEDRAANELIGEQMAQLAAAQTGPINQQAAKWEEWADAAVGPGMIFRKRHPTPNKSGFLIHYELPDDGSISYDQVEQAARKLELMLYKRSWMRSFFKGGVIRDGCVRVQKATDWDGRPVVGEVFICIDVVDILAKTLRMPTTAEDYTPVSIMDAFQVGEFADGTPICLTIHEIHTLIIGLTQHGKSNLLHVIIRQLARCTDAVIWGLDFKGGDTFRLWMNPFMEGDIDPHTGKPLAQCIFDWVAVDNHLEAERILLAALEAAKRRPAICGGGGWVPSPARPAIIFVADEISEVVGMTGGPGGRSAYHVSTEILSTLLTRMMKLGTGQGIYAITASQRGTVGNVGSGDAKSQQKGRIILPTSGSGDASDVLQSSSPEARRQAAALTHKGSVVIEGWGFNGKPGKIWLAGHKTEIKETIRNEVMQLTHLRRDVRLDQETKMFILKYGYEGRPAGPTPDPDRIAWYYGRDPQRQLLTWDHEWGQDGEPVHTGGRGAATMERTQRSTTSTAALLGLEDVPSAFADIAKDPPAPKVSQGSPVIGQRKPTDDVDAEWAAREAEMMAELGLATAPAPELAPAAPAEPVDGPPVLPGLDGPPQSSAAMPSATLPFVGKATYETCADMMISIIHRAGPAGTTGADIHREMEKRMGGNAPHAKSIYPWIGKLLKDTVRNPDERKVVQVGNVFMTEANRPMPTRGHVA